MIDVKIIKKPKKGSVSVGGGIVTAANSYTNDSQQTLADVLNFNAAVSRLLQPYDANNQPLAWAQATDPDGDGGIKAKTLRAAVTFASVGDIVAYQNGNLSGGTGGGGLDITALEDYLTTNGYATQAWVSAHFNDYVLTKAAVEAVLTGNITSHTHSQYLTEHQSLANYVTLNTTQTIIGAKTFSNTVVVQGGVRILYANDRGYLQLGNTDNKQGEISAWSGVPLENLILNTAKAKVRGAVTATQFIRTGGTATQFLKADGSVDSNSYALVSALGNYLPLAGGSMLNTNLVSNLNADLLDGVHKDAFNGAARYVTDNTRTGGYYKIKIKDRRLWMLSFKIIAYQSYVLREIVVTGYHYQQWYLPTVALVNAQGAPTPDTVDVTFGYDADGLVWVAIPAKSYAGISVTDVANGFQQVSDVHNLFEIVYEATLSGTVKTILTASRHATIADNVASATKLQTARTINGTAFDGTVAINTAKWGTARNITIGNTAKSVDGSSAMAWSLAEIGALGVNANAVSASKLQTARTIWGQSFDGTDNVAGTLSGVEDITFNANAKIAATANHLRLLTKSGGTQGLAAAQLLASDLYADWAKVPANGIYSKGDITTDGSLKIGGGTITWDAGNNAFMFSHTVASQGDMVAFENGNLSGGTGGGGLDIAALEDYLTTNGYATQAWVSAHFNDYVLTKAAVEAVLTGNITTHTHNQYLTEHQSLANYYTKTESDGKYLTAINKSMVEAVLTGNITTHTHNQYLTEHQSLANYMTRGEIGDTYQAKSTALSFSAAEGYVAARFADNTLCDAAVDKYIEFWCNSGWYNFEIGSLTAHGAATATQFIRTGGTATQFLKADGSVDSNTYLTTGDASDTYLPKATYTASDILTKIKTVDGAGSGLDADLLDGVHGSSYLYATCYCGEQKTGVLVKTDVPEQNSAMFTVHINGNTYYSSIPIDTYIQFYSYKNSQILGWTAINNGANFGAINVFIYEGYVCLWLPQPWSYMSFNIFVNYTNSQALRYNRVISLTNTTMPTEGVTRLVTITPYQSALTTDNVASATKLQTARAINGTAFDGTAAITTAKWGTARNLTIGNTAKSVDGSSAMAWSLAEIGALGVNANAVSASKLQTAHTLWGQSFDGTDNVAGTLSGVEDILFNVNARLNATDNAFRFFTKSGDAQGIQAGNLLISYLFSDANKVPENGIYSKDGLVTDGSIKIGGGTITWDEATNSFIFSHTVASQGDVVAFKQ